MKPHQTNTLTRTNFPGPALHANPTIKMLLEDALDRAVPETWTVLTHSQLLNYQQEVERAFRSHLQDVLDEKNKEIYRLQKQLQGRDRQLSDLWWERDQNSPYRMGL